VNECKPLLDGDVHEQLTHFFKSYGQAEAATMCLALAVGCSDARQGLTLLHVGAQLEQLQDTFMG
jgi:hypothetical protein